jgi:MFS family permease
LRAFVWLISLLRWRGGGAVGARLPDEPDFWRLWLVGFVIFVVRWVETIAVAVFVYQRTGSAFVVASITMLRVLPMGLFGTVIGVVVDRIERRIALMLIVLVSLATSLVLALLAHLDALAVWHLAVASFINGTGWAADNPVRRMMIGEVVGAQRMSTGISIDVGSNNASRMAGPTLGGVLMATVGITGAFVLSVALYLVAVVAAFSIRYRNKPSRPAVGSVLARVLEGLGLAWRDRRLRATLILTILFNVFGWPFTSMVPVIGQDNLHLGPEGIGVLASMDGVGAFCGAILVALFARSSHHARLYSGGFVVYQVSLMLFALAPTPVLAGSALLMTGLGGAAYSIMQATLVYQAAPPDMRGRMLGVLATCIGIGPVGFIHIGLLAEAIGASSATVVVGIEGLAILLLTWPLWRHVSDIDGGDV